jgi:predicted Zn-dependent protease
VYALALFDKGSPERAIEILLRLSGRHPEDDQVSQALSDFLGRRGRFREALAQSEKLLARHPGNPQIQQWVDELRRQGDAK